MLNKKLRYLQIALNSTLDDAENIIADLPLDKRIILEAGTPLIKNYGVESIRLIDSWWRGRFSSNSLTKNYGLESMSLTDILLRGSLSSKANGETQPFIPSYIIADMKCQDRGKTEVSMVKNAGASAITVNGNAPIETIDSLILECKNAGIDSMIDMMNADQPVKILRRLKKLPTAVILHRGVDEEEFNKSKPIPYQQITKIRANYDVLISMAGGDTIREVQRAIFNDANIVVVWKEFYSSGGQTSNLARDFLKAIK